MGGGWGAESPGCEMGQNSPAPLGLRLCNLEWTRYLLYAIKVCGSRYAIAGDPEHEDYKTRPFYYITRSGRIAQPLLYLNNV